MIAASVCASLTMQWLILCRHEPDAIFVRSVNEAEVKPKPKAYAPAP